MSKEKKNCKLGSNANDYQDDFDYQTYYERHPLQIPEGCRACGGQYPNCKSSCPMFDD